MDMDIKTNLWMTITHTYLNEKKKQQQMHTNFWK